MAKSLASIEVALDAMFAGPLKSLGFDSVERMIFLKQRSGVSHLFRFPMRIQGERVFLTANAAVRVEKLEQLLGNMDPLFPTVMAPLHLLTEEKKYLEWQIEKGFENEAIMNAVDCCRRYGLPFIEEISDIFTLKELLVKAIKRPSGEPADRRLVLSREQIVEKLAAIYVIDGNLSTARELIDAEVQRLSSAPDLPPKAAQRRRLRALGDRIL